MRRRRAQRGSSLVEFTLVGIPMIFVLISVFEMARLVWTYHTLTAAVTDGARFSIVHGKNCSKAPNDCAVSVGDVARKVRSRAVGLIPGDMSMSLLSSSTTITCQLNDCLMQTNIWPPGPANEPGMPIEISATYSMRSMISMFWPGAGSVRPFGLVRLSATSREAIQF